RQAELCRLAVAHGESSQRVDRGIPPAYRSMAHAALGPDSRHEGRMLERHRPGAHAWPAGLARRHVAGDPEAGDAWVPLTASRKPQRSMERFHLAYAEHREDACTLRKSNNS